MEEQNKETEIRLQDLWSILKHCWWLMLIVLVAVSILTYSFLTVTHEDEYTATVTIWAMRMPGSNAGTTSGPSTSDVSIATYLINDYKTLIVDDATVENVINAQNLSVTPQQLSKMVSVTNESNTRVMKLSVTTKSPQSSKAIADAWGTIFCDTINSTMGGEPMIEVWSMASEPEKPSNPISMMMILLIGFVSAVVVYGIYFLKFIMDDKINNAEDVEKYLGLSMLGVIPNRHDSSRRKSKYGYYAAYRADSNSERPQK